MDGLRGVECVVEQPVILLLGKHRKRLAEVGDSALYKIHFSNVCPLPQSGLLQR